MAIKVNRALVLTAIWIESEASSAPFVTNVSLRSEMTVVSNEQFEVAQIWVTLLNAWAQDFFVSVYIIILLGFANMCLEHLRELWVKLQRILLSVNWEFKSHGLVLLGELHPSVRPNAWLLTSHLKAWHTRVWSHLSRFVVLLLRMFSCPCAQTCQTLAHLVFLHNIYDWNTLVELVDGSLLIRSFLQFYLLLQLLFDHCGVSIMELGHVLAYLPRLIQSSLVGNKIVFFGRKVLVGVISVFLLDLLESAPGVAWVVDYHLTKGLLDLQELGWRRRLACL